MNYLELLDEKNKEIKTLEQKVDQLIVLIEEQSKKIDQYTNDTNEFLLLHGNSNKSSSVVKETARQEFWKSVENNVPFKFKFSEAYLNNSIDKFKKGWTMVDD